MVVRLCLLVAALAAPGAALAESADHYRGGWLVEGAAPQIYQFVIRDSAVTGYSCGPCADGTTLAPLEGRFDPDHGLDFTVRRLGADGATLSEESYHADLLDGRLQLTGQRKGESGTFFREANKDPRGPTPAPYPVAVLPPGRPAPTPLARPAGPPPAPPAPYAQPAPWRQLSADDVVGVWLGFGVGIDKQYFLIRRDGERLFGLACGRCDNPWTHGALENFAIGGDTLTFDIVHQDWGEGARVPFTRHVTAHIAMNEMRMDARRDDALDRPGIVASLVGPIAIEATRGNVTGE